MESKSFRFVNVLSQNRVALFYRVMLRVVGSQSVALPKIYHYNILSFDRHPPFNVLSMLFSIHTHTHN